MLKLLPVEVTACGYRGSGHHSHSASKAASARGEGKRDGSNSQVILENADILEKNGHKNGEEEKDLPGCLAAAVEHIRLATSGDTVDKDLMIFLISITVLLY